VSEENLNPPLDTFDENEKITTPQSRRDEEFQKNKITIHYKAHSQTPKKFLLCCY